MMGHSKRYFTPQSFINCAFYSAVASLYPFLNSHLAELGLAWTQCAWINSVSALVSMVGPLCLGPLAHKLSGYKQTLVSTLFVAFIAGTALLFVPNVITSEHTPKMYFDCSEGVFRIEQCADWDDCHTHPKKPATNFSSFELVTCSHVCLDKSPMDSLHPVSVCFHNDNNEQDLCFVIPKVKVIPTDSSTSQDQSIQFDSRFDRWPEIATETDQLGFVDQMFDGVRTCTYKPAPPLLISQKLFSGLKCRPFVANCNIYCSVNLRHRTNGRSGTSQTRVRPPAPCHMEQGNRQQTLYLYLLFRCLVDLALLTGHTLIEAIRVANTNNYDAFYAGVERFGTLLLPFIVWPPICGFLSDYFVQVNAPNYAPQVVIFDGFIVITTFLVVMFPLSSTQARDNSASSSGQQRLVLQPTKFRYPRTHSNQYLLYRLVLFIPLVLVLGSFWGLTDSLTRPFYRRALQTSNLLLGLATSATFVVTALFALMAKSLVSGIGRMHLILLAFVFYALRSAGISFVVVGGGSGSKRLLLFPFEMMTAFCLPLAWVGVTAYGQHLIKRSPNGLSYATGTTIFQTYSPHVIMQYTLNLMHFGGGKALGAAFGSIWLSTWADTHKFWLWLTDIDPTTVDNYPVEAIVNDEIAVRVLLRLVAVIALVTGAIFFVLYHSCCLNWVITKHTKYQWTDTQSNQANDKSNGHSYLRLKAKSENEVYPLRSKGGKGGETTRSMVTLPRGSNATADRDLETSVDEFDDFDHKI